MATSIFDNKAQKPNDKQLADMLLGTKPYWDTLPQKLPEGSTEWKFYSKKAGWSLVVKERGRTIFYMIPRDGFFCLAFVFSEKAASAAQSANLNGSILAQINAATQYVEGRSFMVEVKSKEDLHQIDILVDIKREN
ncbi:MAG: DUF3788 family protein [Christensenellaceae bacterium]|jgi:hypothetical protein